MFEMKSKLWPLIDILIIPTEVSILSLQIYN